MALKWVFNFKKTARIEVPDNGFSLGSGKGPTLLLVHGLTGTPSEMRFLGNYFSRRGYSVVCPRLADHGQPLEILKRAKWESFYETVRETYLKVASQGPVYVAGLSMGALLSLLLAEEFPEKIAGVSCLSPTLFYDGWNVPWWARMLLPLAYFTPFRYYAYFKEEPPYGIKNEAVRRRVDEYYKNATLDNLKSADKYGYPYFPATAFYELRRLRLYLEKRLSRIHAPVQLVQAKDDDMTSVRNSQFLHDRIASRTKEIVLLYNSYHVITADQERETVAQKMEAFFNGLGGPSAGPETGVQGGSRS